MKMGFLGNNTNSVLLFLILLSAGALVGATVFFQMNFEKINKEYNEKVQQLQGISQDLKTQQALLDKVKAELSLKSEREEELGEKFTEVKSTKEQLEVQKKQLETSREQLESELEDTEAVLREAQNEIDVKKTEITILTSEKADLAVRLDVCEDKRDDYKDERDDCVTAKALCTCP